jgi:hypothetical protein
MSGIFISYRRADEPGYAGRIADRLRTEFGESTFIDVESLEPGTDFVERIEQAVGAVDVLVAVIGRDWAPTDPSGRPRLDDPNDFVRLEIGSALRRDIRVIPVLVRGAALPHQDELPEELRPLVRRQALQLSDTEWHAGMERLVAVVDKVLRAATESTEGDEPVGVPPPAAERADAKEDDGWHEASTHLRATPTEVTNLLQDFEGYPAWHGQINEAKIISGPENARAAGAETEVLVKASWGGNSLFTGKQTVFFRLLPHGGVGYRIKSIDKTEVVAQFLVKAESGGTLLRYRVRWISRGIVGRFLSKDRLREATMGALKADLQALSNWLEP